MKKEDIIADISMFRDLPAGEVEKLAGVAVERTFGRGEMIFSEGERAAGFYVVISGMVKIYKLSSEGKEQVLQFVGPGRSFAEVPMFSGKDYPAHAAAVEKSRLFFLPREEFLELIRSDPDIVMKILGGFALRLRHLTRLVEEISLKEVPGRLAAYFLHVSEGRGGIDEIHLPVSKGQLAALLATTPETMSRILGRMAGRNIVEVRGRKIRILDRKALHELSEGGSTLPL